MRFGKNVRFLAVIAAMMITISGMQIVGFATASADSSSQVASSADVATPQKVGSADMTPVYPEQIANGEYDVEVESSSSMFRVVSAKITVTEERITAVMTLSGTGYGKLFMGTGEQAVKADASKYIPFVEDSEGKYTYTVPVEGLNKVIKCAAWSTKKEKWYDRDLVFKAESLPSGVVVEDGDANTVGVQVDDNEPAQVTDGTKSARSAGQSEAAVTTAPDGSYQVDVILEGGSGRASVTSPAEVVVAGGIATLKLEWSSANYDYMIVDGNRYEPVNTDGNSVFEIPVLAFGEAFPVIADTTAMGTPHEIEYTLTVSDPAEQVAETEAALDDKDGNGKLNPVLLIMFAVILLIACVAGIFAGRKIAARRINKK